MHDMHHILSLWHRIETAGESAVLATVVQTAGSSYRLPGARLLVARDGCHAGSISGGCLEEDLLKRAWWLTESGPVLRRYDTRVDDDPADRLPGDLAEGGFGLGCNGVITILLERVKPGDCDVLDLASRVRAERRPAIIIHALTPPVDRRWICDTNGEVTHNLSEGIANQLAAFCADAGPQPVWPEIDGQRFFVETLTPPVRLLVFGAGDDAVPLTRMAHLLGWPVSVFDGRMHYARREKFPEAAEVTMRPVGSELPVEPDPWTAVILMSHSYSQDLDVLRRIAPHAPPYLGILGPRKRTDRLLTDMGLTDCGAIHAPAGLDLGADGPEQVALAIVAEIQAAFNNRLGGFLRNADGPIHARPAELERDVLIATSPVCA